MKKIILATIVSLAFASTSHAQLFKRTQAPDKVKAAFKAKFPEVKKVKWEKESSNEWEAEFMKEGKEYSANFNENGDWLETEYEMKASELPVAIIGILDQHFTNYKMEEIERVETKEGLSYEMEIEVGKDEFEVTIDSKGNLSKQMESEDRDED